MAKPLEKSGFIVASAASLFDDAEHNERIIAQVVTISIRAKALKEAAKDLLETYASQLIACENWLAAELGSDGIVESTRHIVKNQENYENTMTYTVTIKIRFGTEITVKATAIAMVYAAKIAECRRQLDGNKMGCLGN